MNTYDFWRANNEGRPIAEYLKWLDEQWNAFTEAVMCCYPHFYIAMTQGRDRYQYFNVWMLAQANGSFWGISK